MNDGAREMEPAGLGLEVDRPTEGVDPVEGPGLLGEPGPAAGMAGDQPRPGGVPRWYRALLMVMACTAAYLAFMAQALGAALALGRDFDFDLGASAAGAVAGVALLVFLGAGRLLAPTRASLWEAVRLCWFPLVVSGGLASGEVMSVLAQGDAVAQGWGSRALYLAALCLAIGVFEEAVFRGLVLGGLLEVFGSRRTGVVLSVLASALVFGALHIDWTAIDYADGLQVAQALLKVVQAGLLGFALAVAVVRSRGLAGAVLVHAVHDFLLLFASIVLIGDPLTTDYVVADSAQAVGSIYSYVLACLLYLPPALYAARALRDLDPPARLLGR